MARGKHERGEGEALPLRGLYGLKVLKVKFKQTRHTLAT